ncbi:MAG: TonB-dependent receptor [Porticoccaceae bacterium]
MSTARMVPAICLGASGVLAAIPAQSQVLDEIVVTARKRAESMQDIPVAVSSFSGDSLKSLGAADISDVSFHTPNMIFTTSMTSDSTIKPSIRGQAQNDNVSTLDQSVGIYIDDVIWTRPIGANMNLADIEQVEVLRGPQGTLFGRNTTGGAVLVSTKNPVFHREARVGASIGNYNSGDYNLMINAPLIEDKLAFRLAYDVQKRDGWQKNTISGHETGQKDIENIIAKLLFTPRDDLQFLLKLDRNEGDYYIRDQVVTYFDTETGAPAYGGADPIAIFSGGQESMADYVSTDYKRPSTDPANKPLTQWRHQGISLTSTWDVTSDIAIKAVGAYRELDEWTANHDYDNSPYPILTVSIGLEGHRMWSGELQITGSSLNDRLNWTAGLFAFEESGLDNSISDFGAEFRQNTRADIENDSQAFFAQADYRFNEKLTATLGLRYTEESKKMTSMNRAISSADGGFLFCFVPSIFTGVADETDEAGCRADFKRKDDSVDYSFMLTYNFSPDKMGYFKTGTGFRSGGQNLRGGILADRDSLVSLQSFRDFAPEEVTEYEIGIKADWLNSRLRTNIAAFYSDYQDIQRSTLIAVPGGAVATVVSNAAEGSIQGIEVEINGIITDNWQAGATLGWIDTEYDRFDDFDQVGNPVDRSGEPFPATPEYTYSLWSAYVLDVTVGSVTARADYSWHDKHYTFATGRTTGSDTPAEGLLNARLQWDLSTNFELALWARNITNNVYRVYGLELFDSYGYATGIGNVPRTWGLDFTYHFGN